MAQRIAFASIDGARVDQHFGSARYWQVYEVGDAVVFLETRKTKAKCQGNCEGGFEHLAEALFDCEAIFVSKIGPGAAAFMFQKGKRVFEAAGDVEEIIEALLEQKVLEQEA